jgi:hypothetical protein
MDTMDREKVARELVKAAKELTAREVIVSSSLEEDEVFTKDLAKAFAKKKSALGIKSIRQSYKGTGRKKAKRQLWVRFKNGAVIDIWLEPDQIKLGGVVAVLPNGQRVYPSPSKIPIRVDNVNRLADVMEKALEAWLAQGLTPVEASGHERVAKAGDVLDMILPQRDFGKLRKTLDPATYKLAVSVYQKLQKKMQLTSDESNALNKLMRAVKSPNMASVLVTGASNALS